MMKDCTGLPRSLLNLAKCRESTGLDRTSGRTSRPRNLGAGSPTTRDRELVEDGLLQGLPRDLGEDGVLEDQEVLVEGDMPV